jgi:Bacterial capsule synthesis protein PGA_cap
LSTAAAAIVGLRRDEAGVPRWLDAASTPSGRPAAGPTASPGTSAADEVISMSATGDIIFGNAPNSLPARGGRGFFNSVKPALAADLVMGNLEEPLTEDTGTGKCGADSTACFQFRAPPSYAAHLRDAGFEVLNQANNHGYDYGDRGYRNTQKALEAHGLKHTGAPDQITVVDVAGVRVAVLGFSSYPWSNDLTDIPDAKRVVARASERADLVVVQVHMGAEGADKVHVRPGAELFYGENRGDPIRFSHAVIDAGADLVVGHGPHVLRALEFYKGRLIAYSLGNFAGGGMLNNNGRLGLGAVLQVSMSGDGRWAGGRLISTYVDDAGKPMLDRRARAADLVADLSRSDFPSTGALLTAEGKISPQ